jgi:indole-3-glycerol phosphate synthase
MNILEEIIAYKKGEIEKAKASVTVKELEASKLFSRKTLSLKASLEDETRSGIIAEFKRKSPSKGIFNKDVDVETVVRGFVEHGAAGLSILTDEHFFAGSNNDLMQARKLQIPILRKDFIIDEYQLTEARSIGADVILLIAACLTPRRVSELAGFAKSLKLEVLLEIHDEDELEHICDHVDIVGVNNRDLKTFTVDVNRSIEISKQIPAGKFKISESGISDVATISLLKENGFKGFLIGETFMKEQDPSIAFARFAEKLKLAQHES